MKRIAAAFRWLFGPDLWNRRGPGRELRGLRRSKVGMKESRSRRAAAGVLCCQCNQPALWLCGIAFVASSAEPNCR
jgi:hypothetical protein